MLSIYLGLFIYLFIYLHSMPLFIGRLYISFAHSAIKAASVFNKVQFKSMYCHLWNVIIILVLIIINIKVRGNVQNILFVSN